MLSVVNSGDNHRFRKFTLLSENSHSAFATAVSFFFSEKVEKMIASFQAGVTIALLGDVNLNISGNS